MRRDQREASYSEFVRARQTHLRRIAYAICGDWPQADDPAADRTGQAVRRVAACAAQTAGRRPTSRQILVRANIDEHRRPWRRETLRASVRGRHRARRGRRRHRGTQRVDRTGTPGSPRDAAQDRRAAPLARPVASRRPHRTAGHAAPELVKSASPTSRCDHLQTATDAGGGHLRTGHHLQRRRSRGVIRRRARAPTPSEERIMDGTTRRSQPSHRRGSRRACRRGRAGSRHPVPAPDHQRGGRRDQIPSTGHRETSATPEPSERRADGGARRSTSHGGPGRGADGQPTCEALLRPDRAIVRYGSPTAPSCAAHPMWSSGNASTIRRRWRRADRTPWPSRPSSTGRWAGGWRAGAPDRTRVVGRRSRRAPVPTSPVWSEHTLGREVVAGEPKLIRADPVG